VDVTITYFCERRWRGDNDNIMKPIRDALQGVVYRNDRQIKDDRFRYRDLNRWFKIRRMSPVLTLALTKGTEFLHVKIEQSPAVEDLD
jgi:crossover junction endodeoxyribonuclease RusA